jgi:7-keto-8-aminopelargonate synthetase-like enzyme
MTGNPPDLRAFAALAREHDALLYVDRFGFRRPHP